MGFSFVAFGIFCVDDFVVPRRITLMCSGMLGGGVRHFDTVLVFCSRGNRRDLACSVFAAGWLTQTRRCTSSAPRFGGPTFAPAPLLQPAQSKRVFIPFPRPICCAYLPRPHTHPAFGVLLVDISRCCVPKPSLDALVWCQSDVVSLAGRIVKKREQGKLLFYSMKADGVSVQVMASLSDYEGGEEAFWKVSLGCFLKVGVGGGEGLCREEAFVWL